MQKSLIIKLAIVFVVIVLSYCIFWFFKAGQSEKQINKFIASNSLYISVGDVSVSGFPTSQKITLNDLKITLPSNIIAKRQLHIKQLEAHASIFSDDFTIDLVDVVKVQDIENSGEIYDIEFTAQPQISITLLDGVVAKLNYTDSGFRVLDAEKNVINSSSGTSISSNTNLDETDKVISKVSISSKEIEGYTLIDFYKNILEKKVIEGIKTDEIKVNVLVQANEPDSSINQQPSLSTNEASQIVEGTANQNKVNNDVGNNSSVSVNNNSVANAAPVAVSADMPAKNGDEAVKKAMAMAEQATSQVENMEQENQTNQSNLDQIENKSSDVALNNANNGTVKTNLVLDFTITLTPSIKQDQSETFDPTQIQDLPVQFVQDIKIDNIELSNDLYKISISGNAVSSSDDNYPSGGITFKVEKIGNLLQQLQSEFKQLSESTKHYSNQVSVDVIAEQVKSDNMANYDLFLANVSNNIDKVAMEIASKNTVTKDDIAQFDVRREKNLEFLVNEVSVREILGKF